MIALYLCWIQATKPLSQVSNYLENILFDSTHPNELITEVAILFYNSFVKEVIDTLSNAIDNN